MKSLRFTIITTAVALLSLGQLESIGFLKLSSNVVSVYASQKERLDVSEIAALAEKVTVRIEGAGSYGSGVIVKKDANRYTVLTAWHVVKDNLPHEEVEIVTFDEKKHLWESKSMRRIGNVDMAVLTFTSKKAYQHSTIGNTENILRGDQIFVAGFTLPSSAIPITLLRFLKGDVIANARASSIPDGYQILYSNPTLKGMSGGPIFDITGNLIGIHGRAERDDFISSNLGKSIATRTNMGIPIRFYNQPKIIDKKISLPKSLTIDDYLAKATFILSKNLSYNDIDKEPFKKIIQLSNKVIKKDPFNALAYSYIARGEVALGNYKKAIENANKSISINPLISSAYFAKGNAKSALGEKNKGIPEYDQAIKIDPNFYRAYINRGIGKTAIKDYEGAINDFKIAINDKNERSNAYYHLALTKSELEEYNDSVLYLEKSLESLLDDNSFTFLKANIYSAIGFAKTKLKDYEIALFYLNKSLKIDPNNYHAYFNRAYYKNQIGDYKGSIDDYSKAIKLDPKISYLYAYRAIPKKSIEDYQGALKDYSKAIEIDPKDSWSYSNRADTKFELKDYQGALKDYIKAIELDPKNSWSYSRLASIENFQGDYYGAIYNATNSILINSDNPFAFLIRGDAKFKQKDSQGALEDINQAIKLDPKYIDAYLVKSEVKFELEDYYGVIFETTKVLELDPKNIKAIVLKSDSKKEMKDFQGALSDINQAIKIAPEDHYLIGKRAWIKYLLNDFTGSIEDSNFYLKGMDENPGWVLDTRGLAKYKVGDLKSGCLDLKKAANFGLQETIDYLSSREGAWCRNMPD